MCFYRKTVFMNTVNTVLNFVFFLIEMDKCPVLSPLCFFLQDKTSAMFFFRSTSKFQI